MWCPISPCSGPAGSAAATAGRRWPSTTPVFSGRYLKVSEGPRQLLTGLRLQYTEVRNCGEFTSFCDDPAESLSPALNREILHRRVAELKPSGAPVVTFCPICLANLLKAGLPVEDLVSLLDRSG